MWRIKNAWYNFRFRCQRFKRGYADIDVWEMFDWFICTVKPMLIHLRDHSSGIPIEFENNEKGWHDTLTDMICCLNMMDEDQVYKELGFHDCDDKRRMIKEDYEAIGLWKRIRRNSLSCLASISMIFGIEVYK